MSEVIWKSAIIVINTQKDYIDLKVEICDELNKLESEGYTPKFVKDVKIDKKNPALIIIGRKEN